MKPTPRLLLDDRTADQIVKALLTRRPGYLPNWGPQERGVDSALIWVFGRYLEAILQRLNQAPDKNKLAFFDLLGLDLIPAQSARAPIVFRLSDDAAPTFAEANTQVVAPPPPESNDRVVFETEQRVGLSSGRLSEVYSLWPGRDAYINHSPSIEAGQPFQLFRKRDLKDTPHHIYLAHDTLLALAGQVRLKVEFELTQASNERLDITWQYWDGEVWRPFRNQEPECLEEGQENPDSTGGLMGSGRVLLTSDCAEAEKTSVNGHEAFWIRGVLTEPLPPDPAQILPLVESVQMSTEIVRLDPALVQSGVQFAVASLAGADNLAMLVQSVIPAGPQASEPISWLEPEVALFNVLPLDTSQTFFPLGQAPKPGDAFYFSSEEILSKPGAEVTVQVRTAETPADKFGITSEASGQNVHPVTGQDNSPGTLSPELNWQYWNGRRWKDLAVTEVSSEESDKPARDFLGTGVIRFTVPDDIQPTSVNDEEGLWLRAYLVKEGYGFTATVTWNDGTPGNGDNTYTYVINQPPALESFRIGYTWQHGPFYPEKVLTYNDFQYQDETAAARWPGQVFAPFQLVHDVTPALYLGFDQKLPVDRFNLYLDVQEEPGEAEGPPLVWEYWDGFNWSRLQVEDETSDLRVPGMLSLIGPQDSQSAARFGRQLYWLRGRLKEDGPPGEPSLLAIHPNAVWAAQRQTVRDEPVGTSTGQPDQVFTFRQIPVLPDEVIEVRELAEARANVEWRLLALEVLGDDYAHIQALEDELRQEGSLADVVRGDLRLRRDRNKRVTEVWVRWQRREHLYNSGADDRHYRFEHSRGRLIFGDGQHGKVPPVAAAIQARRYRTGGGLAGNVPAGSISQLQSGVGGVESVSNPKAAEGGADAEALENLAWRGPQTLRHRGRSLAPADYETMAREASPAVAVARALPGLDPGGRERPGWVTLIIIPNSAEDRPWPSHGLREQVRRYIAQRAPAALAAAGGLYVTGPQYQPVDVSATLVPRDPTQAGAVDAAARQALQDFFHPVNGGPQRQGWEPGRSVYLSDMAALLERLPGVDYVEELALLIDGGLQGEHARIRAGYLAVAGAIKIQIVSRR